MFSICWEHFSVYIYVDSIINCNSQPALLRSMSVTGLLDRYLTELCERWTRRELYIAFGVVSDKISPNGRWLAVNIAAMISSWMSCVRSPSLLLVTFDRVVCSFYEHEPYIYIYLNANNISDHVLKMSCHFYHKHTVQAELPRWLSSIVHGRKECNLCKRHILSFFFFIIFL